MAEQQDRQNGESSMEEKLVRHMGYEGHRCLSILLGPRSVSGNDYKCLAGKLGVEYEEINDLQEKVDHVSALFNHAKCRDLTFSTLKSCLREMDRLDVLEDLEPFESQTLIPSEYTKKLAERKDRANAEEFKNQTVLPDDFKYDAFICYAREDLEFANTILRTLESKPFHLKLCINYRDILPGSDELSTIVNVIEDRCLKVVVIISSHFNQDEDADFQAKIALRLSPGCRKKRLIPIVCDGKEFVPRILKHITHLDYANMAAREYFWPNLARSLGYTG